MVLELTEQEMDDLQHMVSHYRMCTAWVACDTDRTRSEDRRAPEHMAGLRRRRALAERIGEPLDA